MATELQKLMKKAREVQLTTDLAKEISIPLQKLVNLTQEGKIARFKMRIQDKNRPLFAEGAIYITVDFNNGATPLQSLLGIDVPGLSEKETQKSVLGESVYKQVDSALKKELVEINDHISSINMFFGKQIQSTNTLFYYSVVRANNEGDFKDEKNQKDWPMFPDYLEGLIDVHGTNKEKKVGLKIK